MTVIPVQDVNERGGHFNKSALEEAAETWAGQGEPQEMDPSGFQSWNVH